MTTDNQILIGGAAGTHIKLDASMANRHGLIAGATGTGKTVTLQILAESFSRIGVPVFLTDIKGDLSGLSQPCKPHKKVDERIEKIGIEGYQQVGTPTVFWDIFEKAGLPLRVSVSDMGPLLLSNLLELNDTQTGIIYACFKISDEQGLLLLDLNDLKSLLTWMTENAKELRSEYGNISSASVAAIKRKLLVLEEQGADEFLGEPAIQLDDIMITDFSGNGLINILDATTLSSQSPRVYTAFLLWFLSELYETLPEVGDAEKPQFVCFFDEAHLLFNKTSSALVDKLEQIVRLIRSKGVGVYFITQSPMDIPEDILGQLGMRIQHALRAFTPKDKKAVRTVAETFRPNPDLDTKAVITQLGIGEALVSTLNADGSPTIVQRTLIRPPQSQIGPITKKLRTELTNKSPLKSKYLTDIDRESAYELLKKRAEKAAEAIPEEETKATTKKKTSGRKRQGYVETMIKSTLRTLGSTLGRRIVRGILGSLLGKK